MIKNWMITDYYNVVIGTIVFLITSVILILASPELRGFLMINIRDQKFFKILN